MWDIWEAFNEGGGGVRRGSIVIIIYKRVFEIDFIEEYGWIKENCLYFLGLWFDGKKIIFWYIFWK